MWNSNSPALQSSYTRRRLLVVSVGAAVPAVLYAALRSDASSSVDVAEDSTISRPARPDDVAPVVSSTPSTLAAPAFIYFDHAVGLGSSGDKVVALQDRLRALAFDPGPSDGSFGPATERAVWAYEKFFEDVALEEVTGQVSPERWQRMNGDFDVRPRRAGPGTHVEVLLPSQVAVVYRANEAVLITHVSSGTGEEWCSVVKVDEDDGTQTEQAICGIAVTPGGVFHFDRRVEGWRESKLGRLYNPVYFNYGIAIHGATNVPSTPASRGCVRIPMHIAEYFPSLVANGDLVFVFDGIEQPETYGAQLPVFDYPDPNATTTTTTTTTTAPASTTTHPHDAPTTTASTPATVPTPAPTPATTLPVLTG
jgi:peptidoglycan hydrolase-like protein with peptidoglycan-binding domain